jgi:hypothetical protein
MNQLQQPLNDFKNLFIQRVPSYAVKHIGGTWKTRKFPLHDSEIKKHLNHEQSIACLGRWYPEYATLDLDDVSLTKVEEIRSGLLMDDSNSSLYSSESKNSYHLFFRPEYRGKPPTVNLLQSVFKTYAKLNGIEIYPQRNRAFRLPFGRGQKPLDIQEIYLKTWQDQLYWLEKKDDFDLSTVRMHQQEFDFKPLELKPAGVELVGTIDAAALLEYGLQEPSSRDAAQFEIIKHLWRQNVNLDDVKRILWGWINKKHNGYSRDFAKNPVDVKKHIEHQAVEYYTRMQFKFELPDQPHKSFKGYVTGPDIIKIIDVCHGNMPRMKFFFELVRYMNPRRHRERVEIHTDKLVAWSSHKTYQRHINYLMEKGVLERGSGYLVGQKSKSIKLNWNYESEQEAVHFIGRTVETFEKAVTMTLKPNDFRTILRAYTGYNTAKQATQRLFDSGTKG